MTLKAQIGNARFPPIPKLPSAPRVAENARQIESLFDGKAKELTGLDAEALYTLFRNALITGDWRSINFKDWKSVIWIAFGGELSLADEKNFLDKLLSQLRKQNKRSAYRSLILAYLRDFDPSKKWPYKVSDQIKTALRQYNWPWSWRHDEYELFNPHLAPKRIAEACLELGDNWRNALESLGMGGANLSFGMAAYAWVAATDKVKHTLSKASPDLDIVETVLDWSITEGSLRYDKHRAALAIALLAPWQNQPAPDAVQERIVSFLLEHYKDPRLPKNSKSWLGVPDDIISVLRKWLTRVALEQFFEVVDQVAQEHMWRYRRVFWLAYYDANVIDDAWVLFGTEAQMYAKRIFGKSQSYGILQNGYQVQSDHSVLLMKIGKLTVADWSHNGKCHIWLDGNKSAPKLYFPCYQRRDVVTNSDNGGQIHHSSAHGTWQRQVASYIRNHTGVSISEPNYMPRER